MSDSNIRRYLYPGLFSFPGGDSGAVFRYALLACSLLMPVGCATGPTGSESTASQTGGQRADDLLVVDCLLPGQIRKLGQSFSYLSPRRPIRTTASDCEIRGGEYVAYDRANYATALKIWLPQAQEGDPAAQTYAGEIYEKGLGIQPDYVIAAKWYEKAAAQGYSRAQINLGYLYESGLGVPRDLTTAMNWYRKASGLTDGDLEYVSSIEIAQRQAAVTRTERLQAEVTTLRGELDQTRQQLRKRKMNLQTAEQEAQALRQQLDTLKTASAATATGAGVAAAQPPDPALEAELRKQLGEADSDRQRLVSELAKQRLATDELRQNLARAEAELGKQQGRLTDLEAELDDKRRALAASEAALTEKNSVDTRNLQLVAQIRYLEGVVAEQRQAVASLEKSNIGKQQKLRQEIGSAGDRETRLQSRIQDRDKEVATLQVQLAERGAAMANLESQLQDTRQAQERLEGALAGEQQQVQKLRSQLDRAEQQLAVRRMELGSAKDELGLLQQELQRQRTETEIANARQIAELEKRIGELGSSVQVQKQEMTRAEQDYERRKAQLSDELARAQAQTRDTRLQLNSRNQEVESLRAQLTVAQARLARQSAGHDEEIAALEQKLKGREAEIARQKDEISRMQAAVSEETAATEEMPAFAALVTPVAVGPTIEIIEPPIAITRGSPVIQLRSAVKQVEVIGRVSPVEELLSFKMNDWPQKTDNTGLFQAMLEVRNPDTPIHAVAVDKAGQRTTLDFVIRPKTQERKTASAPDRSRPGASSSAELDFGTYHALVIGNDQYANMPNLSTARNDARAVAEVLERKYGFRTTLLLDANRYTMHSAMEKLRKNLTEKDNLLIYYAGHGELDDVNFRGYWLPVDAEAESTANWISNVAVTDILNVMSARHILVVADSCYSGTLTRSSVSRLQAGMSSDAKRQWYAAMAKAKTRIVLSSGGVQPVLDTGGGEHSVFARAFLDVLNSNDSILEGYSLYREVQARVKSNASAAKMQQNPQYSPIKYAGHEAGEFLFPPLKDGTASLGVPVTWGGMVALATGPSRL